MAQQLKSPNEVREAVRERYAHAADSGSCRTDCCGSDADAAFGAGQYDAEEREAVPGAASVSLGCGNPTAVADLREGEVVLDLGSGGGLDVILSAQRVGPTGKAYGLDMTAQMVELARRNAREAGVTNVEWLSGIMESIPLPDESVDVVMSNCVVNLAAEKTQVLREAARVLRPGGRLACTDVVADPALDHEARTGMQASTGCIAGALTREQFEVELAAAGLDDIEVRETHRVHANAGSAIIRARKPTG